MINYDKRKQRRLGAILGYVSFLIRITTQLLFVPIMLRILGQSEYGVYQLVASIISYLGLLNFGFGGSYLRFYSQCKDDLDRVKKLNGTYITVFSIFALIALAVGMVICLNTATILGSKLSFEEIGLAKTLLLILTINMALTFPISVFSAIVSSREAFVFQKVVEIINNIANPFLAILVLIMGKGSIGLVCVTTFSTVLTGIVNIWYVKKVLKVGFVFKSIETKLIKQIAIFSFFVFLNSIIDQVNWNIDNYLLGRMAGTIAIAVYSIGAQINTIYMRLSDMLAAVMAPKVNRIVANDNNPLMQINPLFIQVGRYQAFIVIAIVIGFAVLGKDFIYLWAGNDYCEAYSITLLLIVPAAIPLMQSLGLDVQRALNKHKVRSIVYAGLSIANVLISIPFIRKMGAVGAAIGTAIALLIGNGLIMNIIYKRYIGLDIKAFWKNMLPIICASIPAGCLGIIINMLITKVSWPIFIIKCTCFLLVYASSEYCFGLKNEEKRELNSFIGKILKKG